MAKFNWEHQNRLAKARKHVEYLPKCTSPIKTANGPQKDWMRRLGHEKLVLINKYIEDHPKWFERIVLKSKSKKKKHNKTCKILGVKLQPKQIVTIRDYFIQ